MKQMVKAQDAWTTVLYLEGAELKLCPGLMKQDFSCILGYSKKISRAMVRIVWPILPRNRRRANTTLKAIPWIGNEKVNGFPVENYHGQFKGPSRMVEKSHVKPARGSRRMALKVTSHGLPCQWTVTTLVEPAEDHPKDWGGASVGAFFQESVYVATGICLTRQFLIVVGV